MYKNPEICLGEFDKILHDNIFYRLGHPFICPICYLNRPLTRTEKRYNQIQCKPRAMSEHWFSRLKLWFPIVGVDYTYNIDTIGVVFRACAILTDILIEYQHPLYYDEEI